MIPCFLSASINMVLIIGMLSKVIQVLVYQTGYAHYYICQFIQLILCKDCRKPFFNISSSCLPSFWCTQNLFSVDKCFLYTSEPCSFIFPLFSGVCEFLPFSYFWLHLSFFFHVFLSRSQLLNYFIHSFVHSYLALWMRLRSFKINFRYYYQATWNHKRSICGLVPNIFWNSWNCIVAKNRKEPSKRWSLFLSVNW